NYILYIDNHEIHALINIQQQAISTSILPQIPTIYIPDTEIQIIQKNISFSHYQKQLINLFLFTKNLPNNTHFYTDASIINAQSSHPKIGIGWISEHNTQIKFNCAISSYPDSTRAELEAIVYLLLILPINSYSNIHLDNLSALKNIQLFPSLHKFLHIKNWDILFIIHHFIQTKSLNISFYKVKTHSNNFFHNQADLLAKQGTSKHLIISNFTTLLPDHFKWHDYIIPTKTRIFLQNTITIQSLLSWSQLKSFQNPFSIKW